MVVCPLCELIEGHVVCRQFLFCLFFVMKAISVCSNIELSLGKKKYSVFIGPDTGGNLDNQNEGI